MPSSWTRETGGTRSLNESRAEVVPELVVHVSADGMYVRAYLHVISSRFIHQRRGNQSVDITMMQTRTYKDWPLLEEVRKNRIMPGSFFDANSTLSYNDGIKSWIVNHLHHRADRASIFQCSRENDGRFLLLVPVDCARCVEKACRDIIPGEPIILVQQGIDGHPIRKQLQDVLNREPRAADDGLPAHDLRVNRYPR
jgi:hypothetical protein